MRRNSASQDELPPAARHGQRRWRLARFARHVDIYAGVADSQGNGGLAATNVVSTKNA